MDVGKPGNEAKLQLLLDHKTALVIRIISGGSRVLKRRVPVCDLSARRAPVRGIWGHAPPPVKFLISGHLRSFLVYS